VEGMKAQYMLPIVLSFSEIDVALPTKALLMTMVLAIIQNIAEYSKINHLTITVFEKIMVFIQLWLGFDLFFY
jgi:hypothetical protein